MKAIENDAILSQLQWRCATKKFDTAKKIPASQWSALEQALILAPSSFGLQPWKFIVVTDPAVRVKLQAASWGQAQIVDASHLVVFAAKKDLDAAYVDRYMARTAEVRGVTVESLASYRQMMVGTVTRPGFDVNAWSARQVYIALGLFLTTAAMMGIDACPMEGFDPVKYDEILGLPATGYGAVVVATAGFRSEEDKLGHMQKVRFAVADVIEHV